MIYCIDIDETLCHSIEDDYAHSVPCKEAIAKVNKLYEEGHHIKLFTGRGSWDNYDWRKFTEKQLETWGIKYHELILGKPHADVFVDDKAVNTADWLSQPQVELVGVERDWGKELWIINCDEYCCKLLFLPKGAYCGEHYHKLKKETFYCLKGQATITCNGREFVLDQFGQRPLTIKPGELHTFKSHSNCLILEISTHHSEADVVFLSSGYKPEGGN
ncbi:MAG: hypothetical protein Q7T57_07180 [Dehalococcoidales bacterium]|nr:hypothetical protein [Dehalococcoidales bacterium]